MVAVIDYPCVGKLSVSVRLDAPYVTKSTSENPVEQTKNRLISGEIVLH